jgi:hypothetical protein
LPPFHDQIKNFVGERTVDWKIVISQFSSSEIYCESVSFPLSDIVLEDDNLGIPGSSKSTPQKPELTFTAYSDKELALETFLVNQVNSQYNSQGKFVPNILDLFIYRLDPTSRGENGSSRPPHYFRILLKGSPSFEGSQSPEYRLMTVNAEVVSRES